MLCLCLLIFLNDAFSCPKVLCKSNNVPADGNCLYWSVALAYLLPTKEDKDQFKIRLENLFGSCDPKVEMSILERLLF